MLAAIEGARRQILFETYIWKGDEVGERFKARPPRPRTGEVYVIYDGFANLVVSPRFKRFPANMKVLRYPVYTAGFRFLDRPLRARPPQDPRRGRRDRVRGRLQHRRALRDRVARHAHADHRPGGLGSEAGVRGLLEPEPPQAARPQRASAAAGDGVHLGAQDPVPPNIPRLWMFPIRSMYLEAINRASRNVWMTHAYFIPDQDFVDAMKAAAGRGVDVRLLVPHKSNHIVADWISRGYFSQLLASGVRIFRFRDAMVHAKTSTVDGTVHDRHRQRRPAQPAGQLRDQRRGDRRGARQGPRGDLRGRRVQQPEPHERRVGGPTCTASSRSSCSLLCVRCSEPIAPWPTRRYRRVTLAGRWPAATSGGRAGAGAGRRARPWPARVPGARARARGTPPARVVEGSSRQRPPDVLGHVVVPERHRVGVAVRLGPGLGAGPHPDARQGPQPPVGLLVRDAPVRSSASATRAAVTTARDRAGSTCILSHSQDGIVRRVPPPAAPTAAARARVPARARRTGARASGILRTPPARSPSARGSRAPATP